MKPSESAMVRYEEPAKPPVLTNSWPPSLAIEVGLNSLAVGEAIMDDGDLCRQFDLTQTELDNIKSHPAFRAEVREAIASVKDDYGAIRRKARLAFEFYTDTVIPELLRDGNQVSGDTKLKVIQYLGKVAGLDAADKIAEAAVNTSTQTTAPSINITLTTSAPLTQPTITVDQTCERLN